MDVVLGPLTSDPHSLCFLLKDYVLWHFTALGDDMQQRVLDLNHGRCSKDSALRACTRSTELSWRSEVKYTVNHVRLCSSYWMFSWDWHPWSVRQQSEHTEITLCDWLQIRQTDQFILYQLWFWVREGTGWSKLQRLKQRGQVSAVQIITNSWPALSKYYFCPLFLTGRFDSVDLRLCNNTQ